MAVRKQVQGNCNDARTRAGKRQPVILQLDDSLGGLPAHVLERENVQSPLSATSNKAQAAVRTAAAQVAPGSHLGRQANPRL